MAKFQPLYCNQKSWFQGFIIVFIVFLMIQSSRDIIASFSSPEYKFFIDSLIQLILPALAFFLVIGWQPNNLDMVRRPSIQGKSISFGVGFMFSLVSGVVGGFLLFGLVYLFSRNVYSPSEPIIDFESVTYLKHGWITPIVEEVYFRLVILSSLARVGVSVGWSILIGALFFGFSHHYSVALFLVIVGLAAGWLFFKFGLLSSISLHVVYNVAILSTALS
ncbi:MAG: CPBP family intramembrane metalloprotease [Leptonema sp. (in: Bacteria)]|nr:CPBP family intramembrane metalloprotease [Leptonema sp. (in: bacteria)]